MLRFCSFILLLLAASGCVASYRPVSGLPDGDVRRIASANDVVSIAWHPGGDRLALNGPDGRIVDLGSGRSQGTMGGAHVISWSNDGLYYAKLRHIGGLSEFSVFRSAGNELIFSGSVPGETTAVTWGRNNLAVFASTVISHYRFGTNYQANLHVWQPGVELRSIPVADTTLLPSTLRILGDNLARIALQLSPYGDEVIYTQLIDPPAEIPYRKLIVRNLWQDGTGRVLDELPVDTVGGRYGANGNQVYYVNRLELHRSGIWEGTSETLGRAEGTSLAISPGGRYLLVDGSLSAGNVKVADIDNLALAAFSPDGSKLAFVSRGELFLLAGLEDHPVIRLQPGPKLLELRRWRSENLISEKEFRIYLERIQ